MEWTEFVKLAAEINRTERKARDRGSVDAEVLENPNPTTQRGLAVADPRTVRTTSAA